MKINYLTYTIAFLETNLFEAIDFVLIFALFKKMDVKRC